MPDGRFGPELEAPQGGPDGFSDQKWPVRATRIDQQFGPEQGAHQWLTGFGPASLTSATRSRRLQRPSIVSAEFENEYSSTAALQDRLLFPSPSKYVYSNPDIPEQ